MNKNPGAVTVIIIVNVIFFAVSNIPSLEDVMIGTFALYFPLNPAFQWWQLVTNMFMHGGVMHILFNMYGVYAFGALLERVWGPRRFVVFYFLCGLGAAVIYLAVNYYKFTGLETSFLADGISQSDLHAILSKSWDSINMVANDDLRAFWRIFHVPALGASGAVYGILVAFGMLFPNVKLMLVFLPVPVPAKYFIPGLVALDLFSGVTGVSIFGGGIAHFAHVGGALIGFLLMLWWRHVDKRVVDANEDHTHLT